MPLIFHLTVCPGKPADIAFIIDESSSIWPVHFERLRDFIANLTDSFDVGPEQTRIAAVTFADRVTFRFSFDSFNKNEDIRAAIEDIDQKTGGQYKNNKDIHRFTFYLIRSTLNFDKNYSKNQAHLQDVLLNFNQKLKVTSEILIYYNVRVSKVIITSLHALELRSSFSSDAVLLY